MPRNYQRKTTKGSWTSDTLQRAIQSVRKKELSIRLASQRYKIPFTTLQNRLKNNNDENAKFGRKAVLSIRQEKEIADHILKLSRMFYGLTKNELRRTVYSYVTANNIPHPFNHASQMAGRDWLKGFLKRNNKISIRKPEATSINRIKAFNKPAVSRFYENLENVVKTYNFQPDRIFNVDETGVTTVHEPDAILAEKGVKQVGAATSGERGKTHTACCCVSASGFYVPPMIIFPRVRMSPKLMIDGPPGAIYKCSKSGWINETLFLEWLGHFTNKTNASKEDPVLLIMDNHTSHVSLEAYNFCVANGIHVVTLPPHTSHKLQPLDRTIFGPFQREFDSESELEMKAHAYQQLTSEQIPSLFRKAWTKICSTEKAVNGFKCTGIYPFNPNIFADHEYYQLEPEDTTEVVLVSEGSVAEIVKSGSEDDDEETIGDYDEGLAGSETFDVKLAAAKPYNESEEIADSDMAEKISFATFAPLPQVAKVKKVQRGGRPKQLSEIMTSPAFKIVLEEKQDKKIVREQKKATAIRNKIIKTERSADSTAKKPKRGLAKRTRKIKPNATIGDNPADPPIKPTNHIKTDNAEELIEKRSDDSTSEKPKKTPAKRVRKFETDVSNNDNQAQASIKPTHNIKTDKAEECDEKRSYDSKAKQKPKKTPAKRTRKIKPNATIGDNPADPPIKPINHIKTDNTEELIEKRSDDSTSEKPKKTPAKRVRKFETDVSNNDNPAQASIKPTHNIKTDKAEECDEKRSYDSKAKEKPKKNPAKRARKIKTDALSADNPAEAPFNLTNKTKANNAQELTEKRSDDSISGMSKKTPAKRARKSMDASTTGNPVSSLFSGNSMKKRKFQTHEPNDKLSETRRVALKPKSGNPGTSSAHLSNKSDESVRQPRESIQFVENLDGLCFLCGEKYEAEFFVCVKCNNCAHMGCSSEQQIIDEICSDCAI